MLLLKGRMEEGGWYADQGDRNRPTGLEGTRNGELLFSGCRDSAWGDDSVLEMNSGGARTTL